MCVCVCECLACVHKQPTVWACTPLCAGLHAWWWFTPHVWLYMHACQCGAYLWLYVPALYTCMRVCEGVCLPSLHCEQQASWHHSEDGLAYQTTGTTLHVSWQLRLSHGVDYTKDMGIIPWTKWKKMSVEQGGAESCSGSHWELL